MKILLCVLILVSVSFAQRTLYVSEEKPTTSAYITFTVDEKTGQEITFGGNRFAFGTIVPRKEQSEKNLSEIMLLKIAVMYLAEIYFRTGSDYDIKLEDNTYIFEKRKPK